MHSTLRLQERRKIFHLLFYTILCSFNFFFFWRLITLQYCIGFCHTSTRIHHVCTCVPHPEPPIQLPPHTIPLGRPSVPAPSTLCHASTLVWKFVSHMILYMFNAILPNHPTLALSHRVQKTVLYICVSFAVSHTGLLLPSFQTKNITTLYLNNTFLFLKKI